MSERYRVIEESQSGHCCFMATVIDTSLASNQLYALVCECFHKTTAQKVADALNRADADYRKGGEA